jgi:hypothetical protein
MEPTTFKFINALYLVPPNCSPCGLAVHCLGVEIWIWGGMRRRGSVSHKGKHQTTFGDIPMVYWVPPNCSPRGLAVRRLGVEIWIWGGYEEKRVSMEKGETSYHFWGDPYTPLGPP